MPSEMKNVQDFLRKLNLSEQQIEQVIKTGDVSDKSIRKIRENDKLLYELFLKERENTIREQQEEARKREAALQHRD